MRDLSRSGRLPGGEERALEVDACVEPSPSRTPFAGAVERVVRCTQARRTVNNAGNKRVGAFGTRPKPRWGSNWRSTVGPLLWPGVLPLMRETAPRLHHKCQFAVGHCRIARRCLLYRQQVRAGRRHRGPAPRGGPLGRPGGAGGSRAACHRNFLGGSVRAVTDTRRIAVPSVDRAAHGESRWPSRRGISSAAGGELLVGLPIGREQLRWPAEKFGARLGTLFRPR